MTTQKRIACIGAGYWGKNLVRNFADLGVLSWICEQDSDRVEQLKLEYPNASVTGDLDHVLSDPDTAGVAIATPAETHANLARRALLAGKHVLVEKPLCLSASEGQD